MKLEALFLHPTALPAAPKVVEELISSFDDAGVSTNDIARKISTDPVLSAKLLRLANSAYYHVSRSIGRVEDAVVMLGFVTVRTLVISSGLVSGFKKVPGLDLRQFWRYSLHSAVCAKWIARQSGDNTDLAFMLGMMHAIGQLVMRSAMPEQTVALDQLAGPLAAGRIEAEQASLGYAYTDVGAELARRWNFPAVYADTIGALAAPLAQPQATRMVAVVHLAAWRARALEQKLSEAELAACYPEEVAASLGLAPGVLIGQMPAPEQLAAGLAELVA